MSSQKGNLKRSRGQKHQNSSSFKNSMHDTSKKTKEINQVRAVGCCARCKEIIEWKIKYKKYKPLTNPKKCCRCEQKCVKRAYYIVCDKCMDAAGICGKCGQKAEIVERPGLTRSEEALQAAELKQELKILTERQRRTFYRHQETCEKEDSTLKDNGNSNEESSAESSDDIAEASDDDIASLENLNIDECEQELDSESTRAVTTNCTDATTNSVHS